MQQKLWLILLVSCSFLAVDCPGLQVRVYISDPGHIQVSPDPFGSPSPSPRPGMEFHDARTGESGFVDYKDTDKFFCLTPSDAKDVLDRCGSKGRQP